MRLCPSCSGELAPGETICPACGTELVIAPQRSARGAVTSTPESREADGDAPDDVRTRRNARDGADEDAATKLPCPDCGETVAPDRNRCCPICGHDFRGPVHIDEEEFFRDPAPLDETRAAELRDRAQRIRELDEADRRAAAVAEPAVGDETPGKRPARARPLPSETQGTAGGGRARSRREAPLPGDRSGERRAARETSGEHPAVTPRLVVQGGQQVFFDGRMVHEVPLDMDEVVIGRRDPAQGHYPDIDLGHFRHIDGHISRRHARVFRRRGRWVVEDLAKNDATWLNDRSQVLNGEEAPLSNGDRIIVSDSVAFVFRGPSPRSG